MQKSIWARFLFVVSSVALFTLKQHVTESVLYELLWQLSALFTVDFVCVQIPCASIGKKCCISNIDNISIATIRIFI